MEHFEICTQRMSRGAGLWSLLLLVLLFPTAHSCTTQPDREPALTGTVRTVEGDPLYGILVSARGADQKYTTSVFTDDQGVYRFPLLPEGSYRVFVGTLWSERVNLTSSGAAQDFAVELGSGFMTQTTGTSWFNLLSGTPADKKRLTDSCGTCHSIWRLFDRPQSSREGWAALGHKMARITSGGNPLGPDDPYRLDLSKENFDPLMDFLTENISPELVEKRIVEAMVRPRGEAARAVFTEWDLTGEVMVPKTTWTDSAGIIWFALERGEGDIVKLDPQTGKMTRFPATTKHSDPYGLVIDDAGDIWFTELKGHKVGKIDPATGRMTEIDPPTSQAGPRRIQMDSQGKLWLTEFYADKIARLDPATMVFSEYDTGEPGGFPYFILVDRNDQVWFNLLNGNTLGKFDPTTEQFTYFLFPQFETHSRNGSLDQSSDPVAVVYERAFLVQRDYRPTIGRMYVRPAE